MDSIEVSTGSGREGQSNGYRSTGEAWVVALYQLLWPARSSDVVVRSEGDQEGPFRSEVTTVHGRRATRSR